MNLFQDSFTTYGDPFIRYPMIINWGGHGNLTTPGRFDSGAWAHQGTWVCTPLGKNASTLYAGMALQVDTGLFSASATIFEFLDSTAPTVTSGTSQVKLVGNTNATLSVMRGSTTLGTTTATVSPSVWHYLEFGVVINSTTGSATVKLDGITILTLTGINTQVSANAYANQFAHSGGKNNFSGTTTVDDVYVNDNTGSFNNTFEGDVKIQGGNPTGNGSLQTWAIPSVLRSFAYSVGAYVLDPNGNLQKCTTAGTTAGSAPTYNISGTTTDGSAIFTYQRAGAGAQYLMVNELTEDDDLGYLADLTAGDQSTFTFPAATGTAVLGIWMTGRLRKDDAGNKLIRLIGKSGATVGTNGSDLALVTAYQAYSAAFDVDPATGAAWTLTAANAFELGVKLIS